MNTSSSTPDPVWEAALNDAIGSANVPTLLMVLLHLSGDTRWLSATYQCSRIRGLDDNDSGGLPPEVQAEVREAARQAVLQWKAGAQPRNAAPDADLLMQMMQTSLGEPVPAAYAGMVSAGLGLDPDFALDQRHAFDVPEGFQVVVIGAGVAGMCASIRLQGAGIPHVVIEKNASVGGSWYENHYPGAGVDTPNHIYSYSFAKHDWTRYFALQDEIQGYLEGVANQFALHRNIRFNTRVESAHYDEQQHQWRVETLDAKSERQSLRANILISAVGLLNVPKMPDIKGLENFAGPCFHTARWPEGLDLKGKDVVVIGNGASAMQVVPAVADEVRTLTVIQRSLQWAAPFETFKKPVPAAVRFLLRELPYYQEWYRTRLAWIFNDRIHGTLQIDPQWPHPERAINAKNDRHRAHFTDYIKAELGARQELLPQVLPDYPPFGKRMLMDNGWYRTMAREHVHLFTGGIREVTPTQVVTEDGASHPADVLVIATGFDAINMLSSYKLYGRGGRSIREAWDAAGAEAYLGVAVPDFPNFFMLTGPNTALGHGGSVVSLIEAQVRYVMGILQKVMAQHPEGFEIEVKRPVHDEYNQRVQQAHNRMIWTHKGMSNWYRNPQGRVVATTPFRNDDYWGWVRRTDLGDYTVQGAAAAGGGSHAATESA